MAVTEREAFVTIGADLRYELLTNTVSGGGETARRMRPGHPRKAALRNERGFLDVIQPREIASEVGVALVLRPALIRPHAARRAFAVP